MGLFTTSDSKTSRRLLFVVGGALIGLGLLLGLFEGEPGTPTDPDTVRAAVTQIHAQRQAPPEETAPAASDDGADEVAALRSQLDFSTAPEPRPERIDEDDYDVYVNTTAEYLQWLFEAVGYTGEKIAAGETDAVPPMALLSIPSGWAEDRSVQLKKSLFYRVMLPLILLENESVIAERATLEAYHQKRRNRSPITPAERNEIRELAEKYGVLDAEGPQALDDAAIEELLLRVDLVPPSLALGQAAYESGYATSRFASEGNALFGQWDWGADAIKPRQQRRELGNHGIRAFDQPLDSVRAYLWNLNTHRGYEDFRQQRAAQRDGRTGPVSLDGLSLAATLLSYSERGKEYTDDLQGMIRHNRLQLADDMRLLRGETIYFH